MAAPLEELTTRISELKSDFEFVAIALQLRPRIGDAIRWEAETDLLLIIRKFMDAKSSRPEGIYGPLLVRLLASFERYLRMLIVYSVEERAANAKTYDELPTGLTRRNLILTGRVLASVDAPRDHLTFDIDTLVANLATCKRGSDAFRLNSQAFAATISGTSPAVIEKALEGVDVTSWWDSLGSDVGLAKTLGTRGARATGIRAHERLKELWRWRNHLAHGGDEEISVSDSQLREAIQFIASFSAALDGIVIKRLAKEKA